MKILICLIYESISITTITDENALYINFTHTRKIAALKRVDNKYLFYEIKLQFDIRD